MKTRKAAEQHEWERSMQKRSARTQFYVDVDRTEVVALDEATARRVPAHRRNEAQRTGWCVRVERRTEMRTKMRVRWTSPLSTAMRLDLIDELEKLAHWLGMGRNTGRAHSGELEAYDHVQNAVAALRRAIREDAEAALVKKGGRR